MMHFINVKNILFSAQYGFRGGFSTEHAIVDIVSAIQSNMVNTYLPVEFLLT